MMRIAIGLTSFMAIAAGIVCCTPALAHDPAHNVGLSTESPTSAAFVVENGAAMDRMMKDMGVKPTGDVDRDFVSLMAPHHQGAIDMAVTVLKSGKNERIRRIAQEIIVSQQQEIVAMKLAVGDPLPPSAAAPTQAPFNDHAVHAANADKIIAGSHQ